ncbi:MAG: DUF2971 domain-containing protein [Thermoguttaceae bacterium]|jgi:hypothetical protein
MEMRADGAPPEILYHYCDANAFQGIVTSGQLWLTNAAFTNDYTEHKLLIKGALKAIGESSREPRRSPGDGASPQRLAEMLRDANVPYIFSFSPKGDRLSQWRAYSDDGMGFVIGFSSAGVGAACEEARATFRRRSGMECSIALRKAKYGKRERREFLTWCLGIYGDDRAAGRTSSDREAAIGIWTEAAVHKNPGFREEAEWRVVWMPPITGAGRFDSSSIRFRVAGSRILSYYALPFRPDAIVKIRLGPGNCARERRRRAALKMFLQASGYDVGRIRCSKATYRPVR